MGKSYHEFFKRHFLRLVAHYRIAPLNGLRHRIELKISATPLVLANNEWE